MKHSFEVFQFWEDADEDDGGSWGREGAWDASKDGGDGGLVVALLLKLLVGS